MEHGALAMNGSRLSLASAVWEPDGVSWRGRKKVLEPGPLGLHTRAAWRCPACGALVIPPEPPPPPPMLALGRSGQFGEASGSTDHAAIVEDQPPASWADFERRDEDPTRR
jgi:hypothetical protein